jgi:hypothetical protein
MRIFSNKATEPQIPAGITLSSKEEQLQYLIFMLATRGVRFYHACDEGLDVEQIVWGAYGSLSADIQCFPPQILKQKVWEDNKHTSRLHDIVRGRDPRIKKRVCREYGRWELLFNSRDVDYIKGADALNLLG